MLTCILLRRRHILTLSRPYVFQIHAYWPYASCTQNIFACAAFSIQDVGHNHAHTHTHTHTHKHHAQGRNISPSRHELQSVMPSLRMRVFPDMRSIHTFATGCTLHYQPCALIHVLYSATICVLLTSDSIFQVQPISRICLGLGKI
jgi:hypothetical protein